MKGREFLNKIELADPVFIEEAEKKCNYRKTRRIRKGVVAAVLCVAAVFCFFALLNPDMLRGEESSLEKIRIPELNTGGMGYEGHLYFDASQIDGANPWNEGASVNTLPVYKNRAYDSSKAGVPKGLSEDEMLSLLDSAASSLKVKILDVDIERNNADNDQKDSDTNATKISASTDNGQIDVMADGSVIYILPEGGMKLPDGYSFTDYETSKEDACKTIDFLSDMYSEFLHMEEAEAVSTGSYNIYGEYGRNYYVYDSGGDIVDDIVNYNLNTVSFLPTDDGRLYAVRMQNSLAAAEKVGDYPIISLSQAEEKLLEGHYQTSAPYAMPGSEYIAKAELVYRSGPLEEMLIPYYRFYVLLLEEELSGEGLKSYGAYYVPAIEDEYIENMPVYDGHFN